jgi:hypothetical protein
MTDQTEIYVYETPDGGDTVYRRKIGSDSRELHSTSEKKKEQIDDLRKQKLWGDIHRAAESDPVLQDMLDRIVVYHQLRNSP